LKFQDTAETALEVLRNPDIATFIEFLTGIEVEWRREANNPFVVFPHDNKPQQEVFFKAVEEVCRAANGVSKSDYHAYVSLIPSFSLLTTIEQASPHVSYCTGWYDHHGDPWVHIPHWIRRFC